MRVWVLLFALMAFNLLKFNLLSQSSIKGRLYNNINNQPIIFGNVKISGTSIGAISDTNGRYVINGLSPGIYTIEASSIGFETKYQYEVQVNSLNSITIDFGLNEQATNLNEVEIKASPFNKTEESPLSLRTIGAAEILRAPGGNRDISRVIQNLPGVAAPPSFRNDIIIRGGAPNENRFFLDGVEIPNINHFATQGSSGGPVGILNVNLISEVDYYAGAFPANRGNALSSVFEFKLKQPNKDRLQKIFAVGSSDIGLTLDGPLGAKSSFLFSARRSYLQFLFSALKLPFLPTYNDFQFKVNHDFNSKNKLSFIGVGAIDKFVLNESVNDGLSDTTKIKANNYLLGNIPVNNQWNYTLGLVYTHYSDKSYQTIVLSRNHLFNEAVKYFQNDASDASNLLFKYASAEIENKFRIEHTYRAGSFRLNIGAGYELVQYSNNTFNKQLIINNQNATVDYNSELIFSKFNLFGSMSKAFFDTRLTTSIGIRTDFNTYSADMANPLDQLSPRLSLSYRLTEKLNINGNLGRYVQLPPYTLLGYRNALGELENKNNRVTYIGVNHAVLGLEFNPNFNSKITVEGFYKRYNGYPISLADSLSLANIGADFGVVGNESYESASTGRAYGIEFLAQQKLSKRVYGIIAYTFVNSSFASFDQKLIPSAWDFGHIVNITAGRKFNKNWEIGVKFRYSGGAPYTPYDIALSAQRAVWDARGAGVLDYSLLNTLRLASNHGLDIRIDKRYNFKNWMLNVYLDIQNVYASTITQAPYLDLVRDGAGNPVTPQNQTTYEIELIENASANLLPSIGIQIEF